MSIERAAEHLGVKAEALADICYERAPITAEWAVRLAKAFGSSPEVWLGMQMDHDLALAQDEFGALEIPRLPELSDEELDARERAQESMAQVAD
jgi:addiction module HigA family antidote